MNIKTAQWNTHCKLNTRRVNGTNFTCAIGRKRHLQKKKFLLNELPNAGTYKKQNLKKCNIKLLLYSHKWCICSPKTVIDL